MATKVIQLFITIDELVSLVNTLIINFELKAFVCVGETQKEIKEVSDVTCDLIEKYQATKLYLGKADVSSDDIDPGDIATAKLGLIQISLPVISDNILMISDIATKTDWYEGTIKYDNKDLVVLFKKIKSVVIKNTFSSVVAKNIVTGVEQLYPDIRFSEKAKTFYCSGGELMQVGVNNVRFKIISKGS